MESELCVMVNDRDEVIGSKRRNALTSSDIGRVSSLWLTNSRGHILIAQRKTTKAIDPGCWGPAAAGTVAAGETYEAAMYREAREEIGLTGVIFHTTSKSLVTSKAHPYFRQWFEGVVDWEVERFVLQKTEVEQIRWIAASDLAILIDTHPEQFVAGLSSRRSML